MHMYYTLRQNIYEFHTCLWDGMQSMVEFISWKIKGEVTFRSWCHCCNRIVYYLDKGVVECSRVANDIIVKTAIHSHIAVIMNRLTWLA